MTHPAGRSQALSSAASETPLQIDAGVPLAPLSTLGVGGSARFLARARTTAHARLAAQWAQEQGLPLLALGDGSNVVFGDGGFPGLVLKMELRGLSWGQAGGRAWASAASGEVWDDLVAQAVDRDYFGIECLSGIPGRVGAAPIQNIGAYGQELAACLRRVRALDLDKLQQVELERDACGLAYRTSRFKADEAGRRLLILGIDIELDLAAAPTARYEELERLLASRGLAHPSARDVRAAVLDLRRSKSMLSDLRDPYGRSVGSFFLNPILSPAQCAAAEQHARDRHALSAAEPLRATRLPDGRVKISAAWLIERAGFPRGYRCGTVGLSPRHALAIVNHGGATAEDVLDLARRVVTGVRDRFSISLVPEPVLVGCALD